MSSNSTSLISPDSALGRLLTAARIYDADAVIRFLAEVPPGQHQPENGEPVGPALVSIVRGRLPAARQRLITHAGRILTPAILTHEADDPFLGQMCSHMDDVSAELAEIHQANASEVAGMNAPHGFLGIIGGWLRGGQALDLPAQLEQMRQQGDLEALALTAAAGSEVVAELGVLIRKRVDQRASIRRHSEAARSIVRDMATAALESASPLADDLVPGTIPDLVSALAHEDPGTATAIGVETVSELLNRDRSPGESGKLPRQVADAVTQQAEHDVQIPRDFAGLLGQLGRMRGRDPKKALRKQIAYMQHRIQTVPAPAIGDGGKTHVRQVVPDQGRAIIHLDGEKLPASVFTDPRPDRLGLVYVRTDFPLEAVYGYVAARDRLAEAEQRMNFHLAWKPGTPPAEQPAEASGRPEAPTSPTDPNLVKVAVPAAHSDRNNTAESA